MRTFAYYRISTGDRSLEVQREALGRSFDREFSDKDISAGSRGVDRPGFIEMLSTVRSGDSLHVHAVDGLGRDAIDVQTNVHGLIALGVTVHVHGLGLIGNGDGELILAVLGQMAQMEKSRIKERCDAGREVAREAIDRTGMTHKGKHGLGRKRLTIGPEIAAWRTENGKSIAETAKHFGIGTATVKRYCAEAAQN